MVVSPPIKPMSSTAAPAFTLHEEAAAGNAGAIELLLAAGGSVDERNEFGSTPLHLAVVKGQTDVANVLIDSGATINAANEDGNTPLHAAVGTGNIDCAKLLLARGAEPDVTSNAGNKPLRVAAQKGDAAMLSALVEGGAVMDEDTAHDAFWAAVQMCETVPEGASLSPAVPELLAHVFDADMQQLIGRDKLTSNVTCMMPSADAPKTEKDHAPGYGVIDEKLEAVPLQEGRACLGGECCEACSRVPTRGLERWTSVPLITLHILAKSTR